MIVRLGSGFRDNRSATSHNPSNRPEEELVAIEPEYVLILQLLKLPRLQLDTVNKCPVNAAIILNKEVPFAKPDRRMCSADMLPWYD
jgi:hypothetical protein